MTRILVLLTTPLTAEAVLSATACFTAQTGPAAIELIYPRPETDPDFMPTEEVYTDAHRASFEAAQEQLAGRLSREAAGWAKAGLPPLQQMRGKVSILAAMAAADIAIIGAPHGDPLAGAALETLLFEAGKPVLVVPNIRRHGFGQSIAVAWQAGYPAASRAIESVNTLLLAARRTSILIGDQGAATSPPPDDLLRRLEATGKPASVRHFPVAGRHIGEALLSEAHEAGADLLVMGAFSHSRLREFLFGGATVEILQSLDLPVLLHH